MSLIRNIIIWGESDDFNNSVSSLILDSSDKFSVNIVDNKSIFSQILAEKKISLVFINSIVESDINYILRLSKMYQLKTNENLLVFFTSSNFEVFQKVIDVADLEKFNVIPWPAEANDISSQIYTSVFNKTIPKKIVTSKSKFNIDLEFIEVFIKATRNVLSEMGAVDNMIHSKPMFLKDMENKISKGISSKILISSKFFTGSFYVLFPEISFLKLYENAVFEEHKEINSENQDFASEIANIIYGQSKKVFSSQGLTLDMAIPSLQLSCEINSDLVVIIPFESSIGRFYIAVAPGNL